MKKPRESAGPEAGRDHQGERMPMGKQAEALFTEWREDYAARARERAGQDTWQVWHDRGYPESRIARLMGGPEPVFPRDYVHVADVPAASPDVAVSRTTHNGDFLQGTGHSWAQNPGVFARVLAPRGTDAGDVVVDPSGRAYLVERQGFRRIGEAAQPLRSPSEIAERRGREPSEQDRGRQEEKDRGRE